MIKYNARIVEVLIIFLFALACVITPIWWASMTQPHNVVEKKVPIDSTYNKIDTITLAPATIEIERGARANEHLLELINKYEIALEQLRTHDFEAYKYFVRTAQFKEEYNEQVNFEFHGENRYIKQKAKQYIDK